MPHLNILNTSRISRRGKIPNLHCFVIVCYSEFICCLCSSRFCYRHLKRDDWPNCYVSIVLWCKRWDSTDTASVATSQISYVYTVWLICYRHKSFINNIFGAQWMVVFAYRRFTDLPWITILKSIYLWSVVALSSIGFFDIALKICHQTTFFWCCSVWW